jgi:hypothetical protein
MQQKGRDKCMYWRILARVPEFATDFEFFAAEWIRYLASGLEDTTMMVSNPTWSKSVFSTILGLGPMIFIHNLPDS